MGGAVCTGRGWEMGGTVLGGAVRVRLRVWAGLGMCRRGYTCVWAGLKVWAGLGVDLTGVWAGLGVMGGARGPGRSQCCGSTPLRCVGMESTCLV